MVDKVEQNAWCCDTKRLAQYECGAKGLMVLNKTIDDIDKRLVA